MILLSAPLTGGALRASGGGGGGARLLLRVGAAAAVAAEAAVGEAKKSLQLVQPLHLHHEPAIHAPSQSAEWMINVVVGEGWHCAQCESLALHQLTHCAVGVSCVCSEVHVAAASARAWCRANVALGMVEPTLGVETAPTIVPTLAHRATDPSAD